MQEDGFQLVKRKSKSKQNMAPVHGSSSCLHCLGKTCSDADDGSLSDISDFGKSHIDLDKVILSVHECRDELRQSQLYRNISLTLERSTQQRNKSEDGRDVEDKEKLKYPAKFHTLICYGLGNFSSCIIARYQLALFLCLIEDSGGEGLLYDPAFSIEEATILTKLQCGVIGNNEEGKRCVKIPTLFYMPHCAKELYNNLLWANWSPSLSNLVILGNSFNHMMDNLPYRQFHNNWNYISKAVPLVEEFGIFNSFRYNDIFNDTAIHIFSKSKISKLQAGFWVEHEEPVYQDNT
ncbi:hypothetical protein CHUAL_011146 [Chamberlinius hualienensis]